MTRWRQVIGWNIHGNARLRSPGSEAGDIRESTELGIAPCVIHGELETGRQIRSFRFTGQGQRTGDGLSRGSVKRTNGTRWIAALEVQSFRFHKPPPSSLPLRTGIPIIARDRIRSMDATRCRVTAVIRTHIVIVARKRSRAHAEPSSQTSDWVHASPVIAPTGHVAVLAPQKGITTVRCATVPVVTIGGFRGRTGLRDANVSPSVHASPSSQGRELAVRTPQKPGHRSHRCRGCRLNNPPQSPPLQQPPPHWSASVQASPSSQGSVLLVLIQPATILQESVVHGLPSSQSTSVPETQVPSEQISPSVHASPSSQAQSSLRRCIRSGGRSCRLYSYFHHRTGRGSSGAGSR